MTPINPAEIPTTSGTLIFYYEREKRFAESRFRLLKILSSGNSIDVFFIDIPKSFEKYKSWMGNEPFLHPSRWSNESYLFFIPTEEELALHYYLEII